MSIRSLFYLFIQLFIVVQLFQRDRKLQEIGGLCVPVRLPLPVLSQSNLEENLPPPPGRQTGSGPQTLELLRTSCRPAFPTGSEGPGYSAATVSFLGRGPPTGLKLLCWTHGGCGGSGGNPLQPWAQNTWPWPGLATLLTQASSGLLLPGGPESCACPQDPPSADLRAPHLCWGLLPADPVTGKPWPGQPPTPLPSRGHSHPFSVEA